MGWDSQRPKESARRSIERMGIVEWSWVRADFAIRQCLPKHRSAFCRGLCADDVEFREIGQPPEMFQTIIGDLRVVEVD